MSIEFTKMHGLGNDFVVFDAVNQQVALDENQLRAIADRRFGVGCDQILFVEPPRSPDTEFYYRIVNADGSEVEQCGNGARCFARFVREQRLTELDVIPVETSSGLLRLEAIDATSYRVDMGIPRFEPAEIPLRAESRQERYRCDYDGVEISFSAMSIGNPHMVIQVEDVDSAPVSQMGRYFESHPLFPDRTNVGFMQVVDRASFRLRVYERGVGETRACGSGACAAMVAGVQLGLLRNTATAMLTGGSLKLEWQGEAKPVMMTGDTAMVYQGEIEYE